MVDEKAYLAENKYLILSFVGGGVRFEFSH